MGKYNFKKVADQALSRIDAVLAHWLPGGKREGHEYIVLNPRRADNSPGSFSINLNTGVWSDFAADESGGDLISLIAYLETSSQGEACKALASFLGISDIDDRPAPKTPPAPSQKPPQQQATPQWMPIFPVPESALASCPTTFPRLGKPSQVWEYKSADGLLLLKVMRFDTANGDGRVKDYRPLCYGKDANGKQGWAWKQPPDKRPLYGLEYLGDNVQVPVLLVEGEKACDSARQLFPNAVVMTWLSGSKAIGKADFSPLAGREVWYFPDHDKAGGDSITPLAKALQAVAVKSFSLVDIALFDRFAPGVENGSALLHKAAGDGSHWPDKADAYDAAAMGWTADHIALLQSEGLLKLYPLKGSQKATATPNGDTTTEQASQRQSRFKSTEQGLFGFDMKTESYRRIGGRLDVVARSRNVDGRSWGLLVSFDDFDGHPKNWNIPAALFATEGGAEVVRGLLDRGYTLLTNREAKKRLLEYLGDFNTENRVRLVERMGWHGDTAFMLPDRVIGKPKEPLHYYLDSVPLCRMAQAGTLEQWKNNVATYCEGNSLLAFAVCAAFAAPLLDVLGSETCGFHWVGDSSLGKSTLLKVAASVYGHPGQYPKTWRTTDSALEGTAAAHSDCLLILDELGQVSSRVVGETVYMLAQGAGRSRATETGASRGVSHRWRLVFLSSGEKTLADHMAEANLKPAAGQEIRFLTLPACPHDNTADRKRLGIYDTDKGFPGGADLSGHLLDQASKYHGTASVAFLEFLTKYPREELVSMVSMRKSALKKEFLEKGASGQVDRAADKFALVAAAGELATMAGITGWPVGEATRAAETCFRSWLAFRGGAGNLEDKQALDHVRAYLTRYGESKFTRWESDDARIDEHAARTMERNGFRKTEEHIDSMEGNTTESIFFFPREGFKSMCLGFDYKRVARLLNEIGALITDNEPGRLTKKTRLPGGGKAPVNCYVIRLSVLLSENNGDPEEPETPPQNYDAVAGF